MFRLTILNDDEADKNELYVYLSSAISQTIIECLDEYLDDIGRYDLFFQYSFAGGFFSGLSQYVKPKALCRSIHKADEQAGYEFTFAKMKRMREKMQDREEFYTFDVFEERILYCMCLIMADRARTPEGRKKREPLKEKVEAAKVALKEKYGLKVKEANDYSRKMYYASAMLLKDSEDDNLIFWDDDYNFFWKDGFVKGIGYLKSMVGQNVGYGYQYTCEIFTDIGVKPPLFLLGSEEANRIANEEQNRRFIEKMNKDFPGGISGTDAVDGKKQTTNE